MRVSLKADAMIRSHRSSTPFEAIEMHETVRRFREFIALARAEGNGNRGAVRDPHLDIVCLSLFLVNDVVHAKSSSSE